MIDARNFSSRETLKNNLRVTVRSIRPDDGERLLAAFKGLEEKTIRLRFFGLKKELSHRELTETINVDFVRTVALVTCTEDDEGEKIIGTGRFIAFGDAEPPDKAEVAFIIEEDYHGLGICSVILRHLARIARDKGITQFYADVLPENKGMLAVFSRSGFPMEQVFAEGVAHVTLSLGGADQGRETGAGSGNRRHRDRKGELDYGPDCKSHRERDSRFAGQPHSGSGRNSR